MGIFSRLLGSDKIIDNVSSGLDKVYLSKEEKADIHIKFLSVYEPFKVAQRFLALLVGIPYIITHLVSVVYMIKGLDELALKIADANNGALGEPFFWIMSFYFMGGLIEGGVRAYKKNG